MLRTFDGSLAPRAVVCVALTVACLLAMSCDRVGGHTTGRRRHDPAGNPPAAAR